MFEVLLTVKRSCALPFEIILESFAFERSGTALRRFFSLFFLKPHLLGDSSSTCTGGGRSVGGELERESSIFTITVPSSELSTLGPSLGDLKTDSCEMFCAESFGGWAISRMEGRCFEGETMVADCLLSGFLSPMMVGSEGLENMARLSLFRRRSFDEAGDVTRGRLP